MLAPRRRRPLVLLPAIVALLFTASCFEGERGYFVETAFVPGTSTGDAAIDAVLMGLDAAAEPQAPGPLTATYSVLTKLGITKHTATVARDGTSRSIVIDNIHFLDVDGTTNTCSVDGSVACTVGLDLARVSNVGITPDFYAADTAKRLRRDALSKLAPTTAGTIDIAGFTATCADVTLQGGTARYCVLPSGMLALLDDGDVRIELTGLVEAVDPASFVG